jgi:glycine C-acetyltransferase
VELLRQRSRPYLFSNSIAPPIVAASLKVLDLLEADTDLLERLRFNTSRFRGRLVELGLDVLPGDHPIVPIMFGEAPVANSVADRLLAAGVYVIAFSYPVVPHGAARIRTQVSAAHTADDLERAAAAFAGALDPTYSTT